MPSEETVLKNPVQSVTEIHPDASDAVLVTASTAVSRRRRWLTVIGTALVTFAFASDAFAYSGVGNMANNVSGDIQDGVNLLLGTTFFTGLGFGAYSAHKAWEAHKQHGQGQARWSHVVTLAGVSAALIGLPALAYHYEGTIFHSNTGVQVQSVQMGGPYNNG